MLVLSPVAVSAAGLSLSVTPTLFEMSAQPLQVWDSSIKVINNNKIPLTVYADVVNFEPQGELGQGKFLPVFEEFTEGKTLAEWITVPSESIVIDPESSVAVPISVRVPEDATPGGHFAAIMIGTKPPEDGHPFQISTSQIVTSLFFVRIAGEVIENGVVRTFIARDSFVTEPEATFEVRFENKGNVHLQPQGEIVITNMWGKERGIVPINHRTHFGNVLPESIRKFEFTWKGERSFTDIGRYKATITLGYGQDERKFVTRSTYFWVVPVKQVLTVLGSVIAIFLFVSWAIRSYVRRMLSMAGVEAYVPQSQRGRVVHRGDVLISERISVKAPIAEGVSDFRSRLEQTKAFMDTLRMLARFVMQYKKFFGSLFAAIVVVYVVWSFLVDVTTEQRDYEVTIENPDAEVTISSEEILYEKEKANTETVAATTTDQVPQNYELVLTNSSDTPGAAAAMQSQLEKEGYTIASLKSDFEESKQRTVIIYDVAVQEDALALSKRLGNALLSARPEEDMTEQSNITVFIGNDFELPED